MKLKKNIALSDTGFLFDPGTGDSYSLNPIGQEIFRMLKDGAVSEEIQKKIIEKYDVDKSTLEMHFYDFVTMLKHYQFCLLYTSRCV